MTTTSCGDPRFFSRSGPYSITDIARSIGCLDAVSDLMLAGVAPLDDAGPLDVSFLHDRRYKESLATTRAGAVVVSPDMESHVPATAIAIVAPATYEAWARVAGLFHPVPPVAPGIHPSALVAPDAAVDPTAEIGPFCVIEAGARIGPRCRLGAFVSIGAGVRVGADCRIAAQVCVSHATLGDRVFLHPGVKVGQEGFSFATTRDGFLTVPQLGCVLIGDGVEIGANSTVDRGSVQSTVIGAGTRVDNLVQIGHNVRIGRCCVIVAQVGISGSTTLDDYVQVGGQAAFTGHIHIGRGARIGAQAGVIGHVEAGAVMLGSPAQPRAAFFRQVATLKKLAAARGH